MAHFKIPEASGYGNRRQESVAMDTLAPSRRSENMRRIRSKDTAPELVARKLCREQGFTGYRIHRADLPGKPDIAWVGRKLAIFVHGCFWHGHHCVEGTRKPKSNQSYWIPKIERNQQRDAKNIAALQAMGWEVLVVWECEIKDKSLLSKKFQRLLSTRPLDKAFQPARKKSRAAEL